MKSATPKHLHPLLGRRMVDWVVEAARGAGVERIVVVASPSTRELFEGVEVAVQEEPRGTGDAVRCARGRARRLRRRRPRPQRRRPGARGPRRSRALVETHRSPAPPRPSSPSSRRRAAYGRIVRDATAGSRGSSRPRDASPEELALGEVNSGIYVFDAAKLWPALERLDAAQCARRALRHRHARHPRRRRRDVRGSARGRSARGRRHQHARRARGCRRAAPRPHQQRAHARRRHDRRPGHDVDRRGRRDRARRRRSIRSP